MKKGYYLIPIMMMTIIDICFAQELLKGRIVGDSERGLKGATVKILHSTNTVKSDEQGYFQIMVYKPVDTLEVTHVGFKKALILGTVGVHNLITLEPLSSSIDAVDVMHTGYYSVPKERSTGSFSFVNNELLNRSTSNNILERLENVVPGLQFTNADTRNSSSIRIRGLSTISSDSSPLIVLDNFPYEGNINNINPNDIESITVLKDAAAASIWGARAGNGVIVITTKGGQKGKRLQIDYNTSLTQDAKPNLFYSKRWLPSSDVMDIERYLFEKGGSYTTPASQRAWPYYVELLQKFKSGNLSEAELRKEEELMRSSDIRQEAMDYLYRGRKVAQYGLGISGNTEMYRFRVGANYDKSYESIIGNDNSRWNLNFKNNIQLHKRVQLHAELWYVKQMRNQNGLGLSDLAMLNGVQASTYLRLKDEEGNALAIPRDRRMHYYDQALSSGLLDWHYRPMDEVAMNDYTSRTDELRLNTSLQFQLTDQIRFMTMYQYTAGDNQTTRLYDKDSYYARDLVNKFTQADLTRVIPYGNILEGGRTNKPISHSGRAQVDFANNWSEIHELTGLLGMDIREHNSRTTPGYRTYNFDKELLTGANVYNYTTSYSTRPSSSARIPTVSAGLTNYTDRYLSYFGNFGYRLMGKYMLTGSMRWDGSNLFGVKTNQKGVPLWSVGGAWEVNNESFYSLDNLVDRLRLSVTYGSSGNVNKSVSVYPTILYGTNTTTNLKTANIINVGNPSLKWELVNTFNTGISFSAFKGKIDGEFSWYIKKAKDLIGESSLAPSTGVNFLADLRNQVNYANLTTKGWDLQLKFKLLEGAFSWNSIVLWSQVNNTITNFNTPEVSGITEYFWRTPPVIGKSKDVLYTLPWWGLDHETGKPLVMVDGQLGFDYQNFINRYDKSDLIDVGVTVPTSYGSWRNSFSYKSFNIDMSLVGKFGHSFRRSTIAPGQEYVTTSINYHTDYLNRWKKPGDELHTDIPVASNTIDSYLNQSYIYSEALVTKGSFVRLGDISLSYNLPISLLSKLPIKGLRVYGYMKNLGMVWKANKYDIDPDYIDVDYLAPRSYSFGAVLTF